MPSLKVQYSNFQFIDYLNFTFANHLCFSIARGNVSKIYCNNLLHKPNLFCISSIKDSLF